MVNGKNESGAARPGWIATIREGFVGHIVFDNEARLNAVSQEMWEALADAVEAFDADPEIRTIVLEGAGDRAFVSGADISRFESERGDAEAIKAYEASVDRGYDAVYDSGTPTLAMIKGYCYGGGVGIAICCDLRICSDDAKFCIPAAKLGVGYGYSNLKVLVDLVGPSFAKEIFLTAHSFTAPEAEVMGLVNRVVPKARLRDFVRGYAGDIAANAPLSLKASKRTINEALRDSGERDFEEIERLINACSDSRDQVEGTQAFLEKRKPAFTGT